MFDAAAIGAGLANFCRETLNPSWDKARRVTDPARTATWGGRFIIIS
jgi:hypothetical protein